MSAKIKWLNLKVQGEKVLRIQCSKSMRSSRMIQSISVRYKFPEPAIDASPYLRME
ncbi:hypothetical protein [Egbenema bharatensis]|uniref:hypothetical protein n=1 Tax=Egbenema bharatensis TaxID=3463334 RepID=UPI003A877B6D